jgi:hypothetical protein
MRSIEDFVIDPDPPNEDDLEFMGEVFQILRAQQRTPGDLADPRDAAAYERWLRERADGVDWGKEKEAINPAKAGQWFEKHGK